MSKAAGSAYFAIAAAGALLLAGSATAQTIEAARAAFDEGRFVEAAELAEALRTSQGYALAAESLAIYGYYVAAQDEQSALFQRAIQAAEEAIRLAPANPEAHFQSAHAMGRDGQNAGVMEALNKGYARRIRQANEEALRLDPELAGAYLSLAAWHVEIVNKMGRLVAGMTYRASRREALEHYDRALELAPDEIVVFWEYANGLLLLNRNRNREQARDLLSRGLEIPPGNAHDRILHGLAAERLAALDDD